MKNVNNINKTNWQDRTENWLNILEKSPFVERLLTRFVYFIDGCISDELLNRLKCHSERVAKYAVLLGKELQLPKEFNNRLFKGGLFHDIGKIGIPTKILFKKTKLSPQEFEIIKNHPLIGAEILNKSLILQEAIPAVLFHHERFNGSGYPYGITNKYIPLEAQIIGLVDCFDALTTERSYHNALPYHIALQILEEQTKEGQWDSKLFFVFRQMINRMASLSNLDNSYMDENPVLLFEKELISQAEELN